MGMGQVWPQAQPNRAAVITQVAVQPPPLDVSHADRWAQIAWVASLLATHAEFPPLLLAMSQHVAVPIVSLGCDPGRETVWERVRAAYSQPRRRPPQHLVAIMFNITFPNLGTHAVGMVCNLQAGNVVTYFDPNGRPRYPEGLRDRLLRIFADVGDALQEAQMAGNLWRTRPARRFRMRVDRTPEGVQAVQGRACRQHGIDVRGMCGLMRTHLIFRWLQHRGGTSVGRLHREINQHWLQWLTDFSRAVIEMIDVHDDHPELRRAHHGSARWGALRLPGGRNTMLARQRRRRTTTETGRMWGTTHTDGANVEDTAASQR